MNKYTNKNEEYFIDLHTHTIYSDGDLTPNELIKLAYQKNIRTLSITDHDSIDAFKNIDYSMPELDYIKLISGIELSAKVSKGTMHILGYNIDIKNTELNSKINELKTNSANKIISILEQIKKDYNIVFSYEELKELFNLNHRLGRPDIAKLCIKNGYANSVQEAFDRYLTPAYNKTRYNNKSLTYQECITLIKNSGGIPVLAHPKSLELEPSKLESIIQEMKTNGLEGIETYHSSHLHEEVAFYQHLAAKYNLLESCGSDYHGITVKPNIELGTTRNKNNKIKKLSILNKLSK